MSHFSTLLIVLNQIPMIDAKMLIKSKTEMQKLCPRNSFFYAYEM